MAKGRHSRGATDFGGKLPQTAPLDPPLHEMMYSIVTIKFLFDFVVHENLDNTLLKLYELILPSVHF